MTRETTIDFIILESSRLFIREFNLDDIESVYEYSSNSNNTYFMDSGPADHEDVQNFINKKLAEQLESPRRNFDFAICLKENGRLIGSCALFLDEKRMQAELGYIFHQDFHHMGYASEATRKMLEFGFMNLNLHRIFARCDSENLASEAVMKRLGMRKEAEMKSCRFVKVGGREQWRSEKTYAMLQKEYLLNFCI